MILRSPAKINLTLDILGRDPVSGYHFINTIIQEIPELYDEIEISESETDQTPQKFSSIGTALKLLKQHTGTKKCARITIKKNIPIASGLGGASSNAATVLIGLNKLWNSNLGTAKLEELASQIGMDVPFFLYGKTCYGTNFGEKIVQLPEIMGTDFKLFPVSNQENITKTANMYSNLDLSKCGHQTAKTEQILKNPATLIHNLHNDFETLIPTPKNHHLSGCGPSTFQVQP
ncbi:4-(cytidine 5'-diphospho)-2-C-methyl-D-erythritol kinase [Patescibacteria group bacterium]|nr:4-(cytidine 5'-diphospho)-2-C-methyl-D-erythritol kinase [Patescibacteria group bacterium]